MENTAPMESDAVLTDGFTWPAAITPISAKGTSPPPPLPSPTPRRERSSASLRMENRVRSLPTDSATSTTSPSTSTAISSPSTPTESEITNSHGIPTVGSFTSGLGDTTDGSSQATSAPSIGLRISSIPPPDSMRSTADLPPGWKSTATRSFPNTTRTASSSLAGLMDGSTFLRSLQKETPTKATITRPSLSRSAISASPPPTLRSTLLLEISSSR